MSISVSNIVNLSQSAENFLVEADVENQPPSEYVTNGSVLSSGKYAWMSCGPRLLVINTKTGARMGCWTFGWVLKDLNTNIVCVDEIPRPNKTSRLLAVGLDCDFGGGMVCIFDFFASKVIRAIHLTSRITSLHVVDAGNDVFILPGPLRNFDGIIAVGTAGGDVLLIDICRQICDEAFTVEGLDKVRDELNPCQLTHVTYRDVPSLENHKENAVTNSHHLAIHLNAVFDKSTTHFILKGPKGDDRIHVNREEAAVSALHYCPQLGSLLIGYNFGALQLFNLMTLELVYTSPVCEEHIPISHFAIQEPADDPKAFCYVWAVYSAGVQFQACLPLAVLFAFSYGTKEYHEGYGVLYQEFHSASVRFQMELTVPVGNKRTTKPRGGHCLDVSTIQKGALNREFPQHNNNADHLAICVFTWSIWFTDTESDTFMAVFDLNQWYKEHMPDVPNLPYASTYMTLMNLSDLLVSSTKKSTVVLNINVDKSSMKQFLGVQKLEEHFCPNSVSFQMCCLRENDVIFVDNYGVQKALFNRIESLGPSCLMEPAEIYQNVIGVGLIPLFIDLSLNTPVSTNQQREILLSTALENRLLGWLCKCASEWANGSFNSMGCSLDFLICWAFQRAAVLKKHCDEYCVPLFDFSQLRLDSNTNALFNNCKRQLEGIASFYSYVLEKCLRFISNAELVQEQFKSLQKVNVYFAVLQWLLNVGLLPECPPSTYPRSDDLDRISAPYPVDVLIEFYNQRRGLLNIRNEKQFSSSSSVLFIDNLIEKQCGGQLLQEQWMNDGGNGLYPPISLQALLRTYLVGDIDFSYKHSVFIYVFLDLATILNEERYKSVISFLIKFPAAFQVHPSVIKLTQAFWQLDHGDCNSAMGLLLDPLVKRGDLSAWHHKVALRSLILQDQTNLALWYVQVKDPPFIDDEDILTAISLYVANNMLDEAFYFEKHFTNRPDSDKFLKHLFNECQKNHKIRSIIYRHLSKNQEDAFLKYLSDSKQPDMEDITVYYHILRSHYMEAFEIHDKTTVHHINNQGLGGQENAGPREKLVNSLKKILPDVNRNLLNFCRKERMAVRQEVLRPTPMSVFVHNTAENIRYKSTVIGAALAKAKQTFSDSASNVAMNNTTESTPFLRTPTASRAPKRLSAVVINPRIIEVDEDTHDSPSPVKRLKLSPRQIKNLPAPTIPSKLETPIVKRKIQHFAVTPENKTKLSAPHSILKVKSSSKKENLSNNRPQFDDDLKDFEKVQYSPVTSFEKKSPLGLSPRKSLGRTGVRFEGVSSLSSSGSLNTTSNLTGSSNKSLANVSFDETQPSQAAKDVSEEDEQFYSPENSFDDDQNNHQNVEKSKIEDMKPVEIFQDTSTEKNVNPVRTPRGRKSYRKSTEHSAPVRSSPRISKALLEIQKSARKKASPSPRRDLTEELRNCDAPSEDPEINVKPVASPKRAVHETGTATPPAVIVTETDKSASPTPSSSSSNVSPRVPKLRPRRSLCRQVLETNIRNRVLNTPLDSPRTRNSSRNLASPVVAKEKKSTIEESTHQHRSESTMKFNDGVECHQTSFVEKHTVTTTSYLSDLDVDTSIDVPIVSDDGNKPKTSLVKCKYPTDEETVENESPDVESPKISSTPFKSHVTSSQKDNISALPDKNVEALSKSVTESPEKTEGLVESSQVEIPHTTVNLDRSYKSYLADMSGISSILDTSTDSSDKNILSSSPKRPKISKSMLAWLEDDDFESKTNREGEEMEVDDVEESKENKQVVHEQVSVSSTLDTDENLVEKEELVRETTVEQVFCDDSNRDDVPISIREEKMVYEDLSNVCKNDKEEEEESCKNISTSRPVDLEINDSDIQVENEIILVESGISHDLQNISENIVEENINSILKKNVLSGQTSFSSASIQNDHGDSKIDTIGSDVCKDDKAEEEESCKDISTSRPVDSEINDSDIQVENEIILVESGISHDLQNISENIVEENINSLLEKNVFSGQSSFSSDSIQNDHGDSKINTIGLNEPQAEVIEIGSSSEEDQEQSEDQSSGDSSRNSENIDELDVSYEANIYEFNSFSSETSFDHPSEVSDSGSNDKYNQTVPGSGLFYGEIIVEDNCEDESSEEEVNVSERLTETENIEIPPAVDETNLNVSGSGLFHGYIIEEGQGNKGSSDVPLKEKEETTQEESVDKKLILKKSETQVKCDLDCNLQLQSTSTVNQSKSIDVEDQRMQEPPILEPEKQIQARVICESEHHEAQTDSQSQIRHDEIVSTNQVNSIEVENEPKQVPSTSESEEKIPLSSAEKQGIVEGKSEGSNKREDLPKVTVNLEKSELPMKTDQDTIKEKEQKLEKKSTVSSRSTAAGSQKNTSEGRRTLRSRAASIEETPTSTHALRKKRSVSVDEVNANKRKRTGAASTTLLPKITEEIDVEQSKSKRSKSVIEDYSMTRRITRRQMALLRSSIPESTERKSIDLDLLDPIVLLNRSSFEGKPDPEEKKVYERSPTNTESTSSTLMSSPIKPTRRLRSASQISNASDRSKSVEKEPQVKPRRLRPRKVSSDEMSNMSLRSDTSLSKTREEKDDETKGTKSRTTRSKARSVSSDVSQSGMSTRSKQAALLDTVPEAEEVATTSKAPKRRTRKNSSQK